MSSNKLILRRSCEIFLVSTFFQKNSRLSRARMSTNETSLAISLGTSAGASTKVTLRSRPSRSHVVNYLTFFAVMVASKWTFRFPATKYCATSISRKKMSLCRTSTPAYTPFVWISKTPRRSLTRTSCASRFPIADLCIAPRFSSSSRLCSSLVRPVI